MDVRMPDGTIIRNVPEGTSQEEVLEAYSAAVQKSRPPVDQSVLDAKDALAKMPLRLSNMGGMGGPKKSIDPQAALELMRSKNRADPITRLLEFGPGNATLGLLQRVAHLADPVTDAPGNFIDKIVNERRQQMNADMIASGRNPNDVDVASGVGQAITGAAMLPARQVGTTLAGRVPMTTPILTGAPTLGGRMAQGGGVGAISSMFNPVEGAEDFWQEASKQAGLSALLGFGAVPVAEGLVRGGGAAINALRKRLPSGGQAAGTAQSSSLATASATPQAQVVGGGSTLGQVGDDPSAGLTRSQKQLADWWLKKGGRLTPGQQSGSRSLQQWEAKAESQPMTSGTFNAIKSDNQALLDKIAARAVGAKGRNLDSETLGVVRDELVRKMELAKNSTPRTIDPDEYLNILSSIEREYEGLLQGAISDNPLVKRLEAFASGGKATGEQLFELQSRLGKAAWNEMTSKSGNRQLGMALGDIQDYVLDLLAQGLTRGQLYDFTSSRAMYRTLMQLTGRTNVINPSTGHVSGAALANALQQGDRNGFLFGRNNSDLYNAARVAQAFKAVVGDSGTATRSPLNSPLEVGLSIPINLATRAYVSAPVRYGATAATNVNSSMPSGKLGEVIPYSPLLGLLGVVPAQ